VNGDFYERAARDLPNFPPAVIRQWFWHAEEAGWPPHLNVAGFPVGPWANVLGHRRPFAFWRTVTWAPARLNITLASLEPDSLQVVSRMVMAYNLGLPAIPNMTTSNYRARITNFLTILPTTRRLPHPPLLLRVGPGFEVLDGNHRLAALFHAQANGVLVDLLHETWVAAVRPS
jgi:hypothetical protein